MCIGGFTPKGMIPRSAHPLLEKIMVRPMTESETTTRGDITSLERLDRAAAGRRANAASPTRPVLAIRKPLCRDPLGSLRVSGREAA